jgi:hypothetical protein
MIKTVNGSGRYMMVNGGMPATTYINQYSGAMNVGDLRYNVSIQRLEVYDGSSWIELNTSHASVGLTPDAERALDWANRKIAEEAELDSLAESNATIADLVEQKKALDHKIKMVQTLMKEDIKVGTN